MRYTDREALISDIDSGDITLSYSSLNEFKESPEHFIRYKMGQKKETNAMKFGSLIHCFILEPDEVDKRYLIFDRSAMPFPKSNLLKKENKAFREDLEVKALAQEKTVVEKKDYDLAKELSAHIRNNTSAMRCLSKCQKFEQKIEYNLDGFDFTGYVDGSGFNHIVDLKKVRNANPDKIANDAKWKRWHWQAYIYARHINPVNPFSVKYYNLCVCDSDFGVSVNQIGWSLLQQAEAEIMETLEDFRQCTLNNDWDCNYEYWSESGVFYIE